MVDTILEIKERNPLMVFLVVALTLPLMYYVVVLFHEWGHGLTSWILGYKSSPFDIHYGGWLVLHCDEAVPYDSILKAGHGLQAALIGISGFTVNTVMFFLSLFLFTKRFVTRSLFMLCILLWSCVLNMMAIFGYVPLDTFTKWGDIGRFVHGLNISPWLVFIPGSIMVAFCLYTLFRKVIIKFYVLAPIKTTRMRRILLGVSLFLIFLFLYTRGYNPLSDIDSTTFNKILAALSILMFPLLMLICDPSRKWVEQTAKKYTEKYWKNN